MRQYGCLVDFEMSASEMLGPLPLKISSRLASAK